MKKIVAVSITCNRLELTRMWLPELRSKGGYEFNHIVVDNGSIDGTLEWLKSKGYEVLSVNKNIGQAKALVLAWEYAIKKYNPDYFIKFDDDCEILSDNIISKMVKFYKSCQSYVIAPINIELEQEEFKNYMPKVLNKTKEKGHDVWYTTHTGGIVQMMPTKAVKLLLNNQSHMLGDMSRCAFLFKKGYDIVFLHDLKVMHRGNDNQTKNYKL